MSSLANTMEQHAFDNRGPSQQAAETMPAFGPISARQLAQSAPHAGRLEQFKERGSR